MDSRPHHLRLYVGGNLGKVIGVEMVDEISFQFSVPFPQGQLGQPNGPQQISCVNDLCTVTLAVAAGHRERSSADS